jgi:DNA-3-methyladenine glycosylase II
VWSAECYLLFALGRPDIMPAGDLALAVAAGRLFGDGTRMKPAELRVAAEAWRPWRSAAARLLWHAYGINAI